MSSEQLRRENVTDERNIEVEKHRVPKMTTHFESLADKAGEHQDAPLHGERAVHKFDSVPAKVGGLEFSGVGKSESEMKTRGAEKEKEAETEKRDSHRVAEIGREEAERRTRELGLEQKEGDMRGKEEREGSEKETYGKEAPSLEEITNLRAMAQQNSMEAIRAAEERYEKAKDTTSQGVQTGAQNAAEKGGDLKNTTVGKAEAGKDYTAQKGTETKDVISSKGQSAAEYATEKARAAKDTAVDSTITAAAYVQDKAVAAKDSTVGSGKGVKDQAVVAGLTAAHYTLDKVAEATKAAANATASVTGYAGEKAVAAKDKVAGYTGEKMAAAKDAVVAGEEKAAGYAGRKKIEAQRELEAKKSSNEKGREKETFTGQERREIEENMEAPTDKIHESFEGQQQQEGGGSVVLAVGETIAEIGQTTKDFVLGQNPAQEEEQRD